MISYSVLAPSITSIPWNNPKTKASRSLPLTTSVEASSATCPYEKSKGEMWTIFYVASISILNLYEMVDGMSYGMILL